MKNPFKRLIAKKSEPIPVPPVESELPEPAPTEETSVETTPEDDFTEWLRSQIRGGIERRERNDIYEAYCIYGADKDGRLICRCYHRYPEHDRDFDLSYSRVLTFDEFNRRLLSELDRGDIKLPDYHACIKNALRLTDPENADTDDTIDGFCDAEIAELHRFCESADTLTDKSYLSDNGVYCCEGRSVVGDESLNLRFRRLLPHDALYDDVAGVSRESIGGYDIDNLWIMSVYNRLNERCEHCSVTRLTNLWSIGKESVFLIRAEGFPQLTGDVLIAVGEAQSFRRFGFYSLDFSRK